MGEHLLFEKKLLNFREHYWNLLYKQPQNDKFTKTMHTNAKIEKTFLKFC